MVINFQLQIITSHLTSRPVQNSGMLPIICQSVVSISVGCPVVRSELQKALDSYQVTFTFDLFKHEDE